MRTADPTGHRDVALGLSRRGDDVLLVLGAHVAAGASAPFWDLPGGTVEAGETLAGALVREWREEVGLAARVGALRLVVDGRKVEVAGGPALYTWRAFLFDVEPPAPGETPTACGEVAAVEFAPSSEALRRLVAPYHAPLRALLRGDAATRAEVEWVDAPRAAGAFPPPRTRALLALAAAAAVGDAALVAAEARAAIVGGAAVREVEEALLQVAPYAGFPRAIAAFAAARPALGPATPSVEAEAAPVEGAGDAAFRAVYGDTADRVRAGLAALHPALARHTLEFAYGRVLSRPALDLCTRELLAVATLAALGRCDDALLGHARGALRLGAAREDVEAAVALVSPSAGPGRRAAARAVLARI